MNDNTVQHIFDSPIFSGAGGSYRYEGGSRAVSVTVRGRAVFCVEVSLSRSDVCSHRMPSVTRVLDERGNMLWDREHHRSISGFDGMVQLFDFNGECMMVFVESANLVSLVIFLHDLKHVSWIPIGNRAYICGTPACDAKKLLDTKLVVTKALMGRQNITNCLLNDSEQRLLHKNRLKGAGVIGREERFRRGLFRAINAEADAYQRARKRIFGRPNLEAYDSSGIVLRGKPVTPDELGRLQLTISDQHSFMLVESYSRDGVCGKVLRHLVVRRNSVDGTLMRIDSHDVRLDSPTKFSVGNARYRDIPSPEVDVGLLYSPSFFLHNGTVVAFGPTSFKRVSAG